MGTAPQGAPTAVTNARDAEEIAPARVESIAHAARHGLRWSLVGAFATRLGGLALGVVLARILTPTDFGLYAIGLAAMYFVMHVNDMGIIAATVQWRGKLDDMAPTATTMALFCSIAIYAAFWLAAPSVASFAGSPDATPVIRLLTTVMLLDGVTAVRVGSLQRSFQQHHITIANMFGLSANAAVAIPLAVWGAGAMSFAAGQVAGAIITACVVLRAARMPWRFGFDRGIAKHLMRFGVPLAAALGVEAVLLNTDYIVVGRVAGATALGFYLLAFNVSSWAPGVIGTAIRWVSVPSFSRLSEHDGDLSPAVRRSVTVLFAVVLPIAILTAVLAPAIIGFLYGDSWAPSAPVLRYLIVLGAVRMLAQLTVDVLIGAGVTRSALWLNLGWTIALVPALVIGANRDGTRGVAVAHVLVALGVALPLAFALLHHAGVQLRPMWITLVRPIVAGLLAAVVCILVAELAGDSHLVKLIAAGGSALVVYTVVALPRDLRRRLTAQVAATVTGTRTREASR
jgi:PST family polysaccharide transporter